jgi:homocysteine S-methyltransferase
MTTVWDIDAIDLVRLIKKLNEGNDWYGTAIGRPTEFMAGCAVTPEADDLARELDRLRRKIDAGADFVMTQPLFSMVQLERFLDTVGGRLPVPLILGVLPLENTQHTELVHAKVPGIVVPDEVRQTMARAGEAGREVGIELASQLVAHARRLVDGIYVITSYGKYAVAEEIVRRTRRTTTTEGGA